MGAVVGGLLGCLLPSWLRSAWEGWWPPPPRVEVVTESASRVTVSWLPDHFSQSRLARSDNGSNACTLIVLLLAQRSHIQSLKISNHGRRPLTPALIEALRDSILEGNSIHETLFKKGELVEVNLTVPEAIAAAGRKMRSVCEWKSCVHMKSLGATLADELISGVKDWFVRRPKDSDSDLYVVLITESRTVLIVVQESTGLVTLIDSHQHSPYGAVVAQTPLCFLASLCTWYSETLTRLYGLSPDCYELSYLYFKPP